MEVRLVWRWCSSSIYSSGSAYEALFYGHMSIFGAKELRKTEVSGKCRFFIWLVLHGRTWTSDRLHQHGLHNDAVCTLCAQGTEMLYHLLAGCVFTREVWFKLLCRCS
jgi:hypothetical protein